MPAEVHFLDVGQAHATVAIDADSALVVDCPQSGVPQATTLLNQLRPTQFDVVVTHQDMDHCKGISSLIRQFGTSSTTLYMNPVGRRRPQDYPNVKTVLQGILSAVEETGASTADAVAGTAGNTGSVGWSVLAPPHSRILGANLLRNVGNAINRLSAVVLVRIGSFTFLIPGDIDDVAIRKLLASGASLSADVLLLPHHGAKLAMINRLLAAVDPDYVVISAGRRRTHPALETLSAAASYGCRLMCTQATRHCHPDDLASKHCAGTIVFDLSGGSPSVAPSPVHHQARINQLKQPVCV
ncbi:MAG: hypothetical protein OXM54_11555 [Acidimicrobiaceae bacterium]|nr:hypothetical protein [Acidimicrobiaceae bacterium]